MTSHVQGTLRSRGFKPLGIRSIVNYKFGEYIETHARFAGRIEPRMALRSYRMKLARHLWASIYDFTICSAMTFHVQASNIQSVEVRYT